MSSKPSTLKKFLNTLNSSSVATNSGSGISSLFLFNILLSNSPSLVRSGVPSSASSFATSNCSSSSSSFSSYSGCSQSVPEITSTLALKSLVECISKLIELSCASSSCTASSFSVLSDFSASTLSAFSFSVLSSAFLVSSHKSCSGIPVSKSISGASILGSSSSTTTSPVLLPVSMSALGIVNIAVLPKSSAVSEASF